MKLSKDTLRYERILKEHRRALHRIPEISFDLPKTQAYILQTLNGIGVFELQKIAKSGVLARLNCGKAKTVAVRADMDALPVEEKTGLAFASEHKGNMHACGHDGHMAAVLAAAQMAHDRADRLPHNMLFLFQPAEETVGGAQNMIEEGALSGVDEIYGIHLWPEVPKGKIALKSGAIMAGMNDIDVHIAGKSLHAAKRKEGADALLAASEYALLAQQEAPKEVVFNAGKIRAGVSRNIVAGNAEVQATLRSYDDALSGRVIASQRRLLEKIDEKYATHSTLNVVMYYPALMNDAALCCRAKELLGDTYLPAVPALQAEDFAFYAAKIPALYAFVGTGGEMLHSDRFDFDEDVLLMVLEYYKRMCLG